ncbi:hypothetical protein FRC07_003197 [Ceratobasidium sp. 392]|nr:hypothetical protein FRC07_003197 [Ceratobasidium sp. 392]
MSDWGLVGQVLADTLQPAPNNPPHPSHQHLERNSRSTNPLTITTQISEGYLATCDLPSYYSLNDTSTTRLLVDCSTPALPSRPLRTSRDSNANVTFENETTQPVPPRSDGRKLRRMTMSDVGLDKSEPTAGLSRGHHTHPTSNSEQQKSKSSTGVTGWLMRTLSIENYLGASRSDIAQGGEPGHPRTTNKLSKRKGEAPTRSGRATSTVSLPPGIGAGVFSSTSSPLLDPKTGRPTKNHNKLSYYDMNEHDSAADWNLASPASDQLSRSTTQSAPARLDVGRKLVKRYKGQAAETATMPSSKSTPGEHMPGYLPLVQAPFEYEPLFLSALDLGSAQDEIQTGIPRLTSLRRRWTLADVDDKEFLRQLEANLIHDGNHVNRSRVLEEFVMGTNQSNADVEPEVDPGYETDESATERDCARARRAILCVREIVRTERSYLQSMMSLLNENQSNMSPILLEHLPYLIKISAQFTVRLEEDPSVWGVSTAFLAVEEQLEDVLVKWSGVVGQVISSIRTWGDNQAASECDYLYGSTSGKAASLWTRRRSVTTGAVPSQQLRLNLTMTPMNDKSARAANRRKLAEQNVTIMPTQRVLRYVLMYRVELTLQGATRIARLCDEAQTLVALHSPK